MHPTHTLSRLENNLGVALFDGLLVFSAVSLGLLLHVATIESWFPLMGLYAATVAVCVLIILAVHGLYARGARPIHGLVGRAIGAALLAMALTWAVLAFLPGELATQGALKYSSMAAVVAVVVRRANVARINADPTRGQRERTLIFGSGEAARVVADTLRSADRDLEIVGFYPGPNEKCPAVPDAQMLSRERSLIQTAHECNVDEIVVALTERRGGSMPLRELLDCKAQGVKVQDLNSHFERRLGQIRIDFLNAGWLIFGDGFNQGLQRTMVKRVFDVFCAGLLLLLTAPVMLLAALAVKLDSRGPVLYRQERVGLDNRTFQVVKFRSMRQDAEKDGKPRWATTGDDRITRVGRLLRVTRIDELPQLFSVLRGDMSLVGPRPERPFFVDQLTQEVPFYALRHSVKPGVTGWAQVRYQYGSTIEDSMEKLQYDLFYVKNHNLWLDMRILIDTVTVVLTGKGAR
jgi:sugar transferase (PEP-CTERM system associated)